LLDKDVSSLNEIQGFKSDIKLLAILIQNSYHFRNAKRTGAVADDSVIDFTLDSINPAKNYLAKQLRSQILGRLRWLESDLL